MTSFRTAQRSVTGRRKYNQDFIGVETIPLLDGTICRVLVIADGMGGAPAGDIASAIAVHRLVHYITEKLRDGAVDDISIRWVLEGGYNAAHAGVVKAANDTPERTGMGTTLVSTVIIGNQFVVGNVGDSRAYLIDSGDINQLTIDHSVRISNKTRGRNSIRTELTATASHALIRVVGDPLDPPELDIFPKTEYSRLSRGQVILLCSDGLYNAINDDTIHDIICSTDDLKSAADVLVNAAWHAGSSDNISVALLESGRFPRRKEKLRIPPSIFDPIESGNHHPVWMIVLALVLLLGLIVLGYISYISWRDIKTSDQSEPRNGGSLESFGTTFGNCPEATDNSNSRFSDEILASPLVDSNRTNTGRSS